MYKAWSLIGEGETVALAQLAADFLEKKKRPMRIAIEEAGWRFNNLSKYEIKDIMESKIKHHGTVFGVTHLILLQRAIVRIHWRETSSIE